VPPHPQLVVGAALIRGVAPLAEVLSTQRTEPPSLAGQWEFPGGKVEVGEGPEAALAREIKEELGLEVTVGAQIGPEVSVAGGRYLLRVYVCGVISGELTLTEHSASRWLRAEQLDDVAWIEADAPIVAAVAARLAGSSPS
jgi:8-oxo-dGTP diphosphatase